MVAHVFRGKVHVKKKTNLESTNAFQTVGCGKNVL